LTEPQSSDAPTIPLTETEHAAYQRIFDASKKVALGRDEHRIVDPVGKVLDLFGDDETAAAFVRRLAELRLIAPIFTAQLPGIHAVRDEAPSAYRVALDAFVEMAGRVRIVPDRPLRREIVALRTAIAAKRQARESLEDRRKALQRELDEVAAALAKGDADVEKAEALLERLQAMAQEIAEFV
jgi:hypothetical protein